MVNESEQIYSFLCPSPPALAQAMMVTIIVCDSF